MGKLFGTDGIRGIANKELTVNLAFNTGLALSEIMSENASGAKPKVLISKDTRISGDMFESAIAAGLCAGGVDVILCGVAPTPAVSYLVKEFNFDAGVMISASHNPSEYNGIKIFNRNGFKLSDELEEKIEYAIENNRYIKLATGKNIGVVDRDYNLINEYIEHVSGIKAEDATGDLKILIDCANGSASVTASKIFTQCDIINAAPDGLNINNRCGSMNLDLLVEKVVEGKYDIGIAFDGDADRCLAVDENGDIIDGDMILCAIADAMKEAGTLKNDTLVVTKLSNLGLHKFCERRNYNVSQTDVGDRFVLERMVENNYNLGGEQSGHIIVLDYAGTGDGQLTAVLMLNLLCKKNEKASKVFGVMKKYPQISLNVKISQDKDKAGMKEKILSDCDVINAEKAVREKLNNNGRIILRASGTEPLIRIMIEGKSEDIIAEYAKEIEGVIKNKAGI